MLRDRKENILGLVLQLVATERLLKATSEVIDGPMCLHSGQNVG